MAKVTFIVGLCGSGKSTLVQEMQRAGPVKVFDDGFADSPAKRRELIENLRLGKECVVADIPYCLEGYRRCIELIIREELPDIEINWIWFENSLAKANQNVLKRQDGRDTEALLRINSRVSPQYTIPPGTEIRSIIT